MTGVLPHGLRAATAAVSGSFALQGLGYAIIVTALPSFKAAIGIDDAMVSIILLCVCATAAAGSVLADVVAVRSHSKAALLLGFGIQLLCLLVIALAPLLPVFVAAVLVYGVGLGMVDASSNMQGVLLQRRVGRPLLGKLYAAYTVGAIAGALAMSSAILFSGGAAAALLVAAVLQVVFFFAARSSLDTERSARPARRTRRAPLSRRPIVVVGLVVFAAFTVDAAVSSWSTVHLTALGAAAALAPLGYACYQGGILLMRLVTDPLTRVLGPRILLVLALALGAAGGLIASLVPGPGAAIVGFAVSGLAVGALVPTAFGLSGRIDADRSDEIVARVNLFNYAGAVLGAVGVGLVIDAAGGAIAFLLPVLVLFTALPAVRFARRESRSAADTRS